MLTTLLTLDKNVGVQEFVIVGAAAIKGMTIQLLLLGVRHGLSDNVAKVVFVTSELHVWG